MTAGIRQIGRLTSSDIVSSLSAGSILCLPIGSYEQHGPHLPLRTDTVIAEQFTGRLIQQYGDSHDLWALPALPYGLSPEHAWSPGTVTLPIGVLAELIDAVCGEYVRATTARNLLIVNGHGGNRGILEAVIYELRRRHDVNVCVVHPSSLATVRIDSELPEVHAGLRETSVMLALAPEDVHLDRLPDSYEPDPAHADNIRRLVLDRGTTWPWDSDNASMSRLGIIGGNARRATAELGEQVIASALSRCPDVLARLNKPGP